MKKDMENETEDGIMNTYIYICTYMCVYVYITIWIHELQAALRCCLWRFLRSESVARPAGS